MPQIDLTVLLAVIAAGAAISYVCRELIREFAGLLGQSDIEAKVTSDHLKAMAASRKKAALQGGGAGTGNSNLVMAAAEESEIKSGDDEINSFRLTLADKLYYAGWPLTPIQYRCIQFLATMVFFIPAYFHLTIFLQITVLFLIPALITKFLNASINRRVVAFDRDYPVMLMQYVSVLKTGMSPVAGLEAVSRGFDTSSLVRAEIEALVSRLRLGMNEEKAIHAFGSHVAHPEIELFVQSLLLHSRVGGTLSTTLERLAKQVRKRQQYRDQAVAAVGMERMSIYAIAAILTALLFYMVIKSPELVVPGFTDPMGQGISQAGMALIALGYYWSTVVTKIKV